MPNTWNDPYANTPAGGGQPYKPQRANNASEQVLGLYQSNFGRSASSPEVDTWIKNATGGAGSAYLNNDQLAYIQNEFKKAPEYGQYQGARPTMQPGEFIGGVTLGTSLYSDPALQAQPTMGGGLTQAQPGPAPVPAPATPSVLAPSPLQGSTSGPTALANPGAAQQETTTAGLQSLIRDQLINQMSAPLPTAQSAQLAPAISAFGAAQNRATARQVAQNAEAFGAQGLESSGARLAADRGAIEQQGLNEATFASQAVLGELNSQRQQAQNALQNALAMNDQDLSRRLQDRLASIDAQIRRDSLAQTGKLGQADIDLRGKLGYGNLNLGMLGLIQQGDQFNKGLGFNIANAEALLNNNAVRTLLGY